MSTAKSRINVSVPDDVKLALVQLAKRDQVPTATKAVRLIELGIELEEDQVWGMIAAKRNKNLLHSTAMMRYLDRKQCTRCCMSMR